MPRLQDRGREIPEVRFERSDTFGDRRHVCFYNLVKLSNNGWSEISTGANLMFSPMDFSYGSCFTGASAISTALFFSGCFNCFLRAKLRLFLACSST
jgi:hypothetical protein